MLMLPLILNAVVIAAVAVELVAIAMGYIGATQLLLVSAISGVMVVLSFTLSRAAMLNLDAAATGMSPPMENTGK